MRFGCVAWIFVAVTVVSSIAACAFYFDDQTAKAIFWLILALAAYSRSPLARLTSAESAAIERLDAIERTIREAAEDIRVTVRTAARS